MNWAALYVAIIVTVNVMFGQGGTAWILAANVSVGLGFVVRDFAQDKLGDRVLYATGLGMVISFLMASPAVAVPSAVAFAVSEAMDWAVVRRLRHHAMWRRVAVSHLFSVPLDSALFLAGISYTGIGPWSWTGFATMVGMKFLALGILFFWRRDARVALA